MNPAIVGQVGAFAAAAGPAVTAAAQPAKQSLAFRQGHQSIVSAAGRALADRFGLTRTRVCLTGQTGSNNIDPAQQPTPSTAHRHQKLAVRIGSRAWLFLVSAAAPGS